MLLALVVMLGRRISAVLGRQSLNVAYCTSLKPTLIGTKRVDIFYGCYRRSWQRLVLYTL
jgi:hypothetical protein